MVFLAFSAAFVGFMHSLAPGHWIPIVLVSKTRRWPRRKALIGAMVAASGHVILSLILGTVAIFIGAHFLTAFEAEIERYGGLLIGLFGVAYAANAYFRHSHCHGHSHHGPKPGVAAKKDPFVFLFSMGFSPCVAVLPVFVAAAPRGVTALSITMLGFSLGVIGALASATLLVSSGMSKLDHPFLEHYGDVITGLGVALMGAILFLLPSIF
jgi:cytochrome c biogenesis protein CcdA